VNLMIEFGKWCETAVIRALFPSSPPYNFERVGLAGLNFIPLKGSVPTTPRNVRSFIAPIPNSTLKGAEVIKLNAFHEVERAGVMQIAEWKGMNPLDWGLDMLRNRFQIGTFKT